MQAHCSWHHGSMADVVSRRQAPNFADVVALVWQVPNMLQRDDAEAEQVERAQHPGEHYDGPNDNDR